MPRLRKRGAVPPVLGGGGKLEGMRNEYGRNIERK
jgi:hypothetical protein